MYRTDKQFMKNPDTAGARIYVGGIPNTVVADDLEIKFRQHGKILGLVLQKGFAFIQFETESQAKESIAVEHSSLLHGKKIAVKPALPDKKHAGPNTTIQKPQGAPANVPPAPVQNLNIVPPAAPLLDPPKPVQNDDPPTSQYDEEDVPEENFEDQGYQFQEKRQHPGSNRSKNVVSPEGGPFDDNRGDKRKRGRRGGRGRDRSRQDNFRGGWEPREGPPQNQFFGREDSFNNYNNPPPVVDRPERNDCEIIVVSKPLTEYAEYIEQRLKSLGLIVDLLFPNEDIPIGRVLANISSRGCLYAILVMPQNEEHKSLNLNILHGIAQEHRNMPIEDALILIMKNFDSYMRGEKSGVENSSDALRSLNDKHPHSMQLVLNMLAENRHLTSVQYDKLLKYLEERRQLQHQYEVNEGIEINSEGSDNKQTELQNRILNILNKSSEPTSQEVPEPLIIAPAAPTAAPTVESSSGGPPQLLKDPSIQKALDSLMLGDMFKSIGSA